MPTGIKLGLSAVVAAVGAGAWHLESAYAGRGDLGMLAAGLAALMVLAMWLFPETGGRK